MDWPEVHKQLKRKGVTLQLLWNEHRRDHPNGYGYSRCCELYAAWVSTAEPRMTLEHKAGDTLFVDYAGLTMPITNPKTGEVTHAQVFVASLGASNYTFAEATLTPSLPDWIGSHIRCFKFLGGVPRILVTDNLKSAVRSASRYEPEINPTYYKLANHYDFGVVPARVRKPRDKAKVENSVQQVERRLLAPLRNHTFHTLHELNAALAPLLAEHNALVTKALGCSRKELFESTDKPALRSLPEHSFAEGIWSKARVNLDYHVVVEQHRYSVPYQRIHETVDVHLTGTTVEIFVGVDRVASHRRSDEKLGFTTIPEHMPPNHAKYLQKTDFEAQACEHGPHTKRLISLVLENRRVHEQAYRSCLGILRLATEYGSERMEAAAQRAVLANEPTYQHVKAILKSGLDKAPLPAPEPKDPPIEHENIRGAAYYGDTEEKENV